jgi:hypothetical protein
MTAISINPARFDPGPLNPGPFELSAAKLPPMKPIRSGLLPLRTCGACLRGKVDHVDFIIMKQLKRPDLGNSQSWRSIWAAEA